LEALFDPLRQVLDEAGKLVETGPLQNDRTSQMAMSNKSEGIFAGEVRGQRKKKSNLLRQRERVRRYRRTRKRTCDDKGSITPSQKTEKQRGGTNVKREGESGFQRSPENGLQTCGVKVLERSSFCRTEKGK